MAKREKHTLPRQKKRRPKQEIPLAPKSKIQIGINALIPDAVGPVEFDDAQLEAELNQGVPGSILPPFVSNKGVIGRGEPKTRSTTLLTSTSKTIFLFERPDFEHNPTTEGIFDAILDDDSFNKEDARKIAIFTASFMYHRYTDDINNVLSSKDLAKTDFEDIGTIYTFINTSAESDDVFLQNITKLLETVYGLEALLIEPPQKKPAQLPSDGLIGDAADIKAREQASGTIGWAREELLASRRNASPKKGLTPEVTVEGEVTTPPHKAENAPAKTNPISTLSLKRKRRIQELRNKHEKFANKSNKPSIKKAQRSAAFISIEGSLEFEKIKNVVKLLTGLEDIDRLKISTYLSVLFLTSQDTTLSDKEVYKDSARKVSKKEIAVSSLFFQAVIGIKEDTELLDGIATAHAALVYGDVHANLSP